MTRLALKTTKAQPFASLATGSRPAKGPITEIQARSDADLDKLKEQLGVTDRDVCVLIKHFYRLKDDTGSYYATDADGYQLPTLSLADWHARYDLIFPSDAA